MFRLHGARFAAATTALAARRIAAQVPLRTVALPSPLIFSAMDIGHRAFTPASFPQANACTYSSCVSAMAARPHAAATTASLGFLRGAHASACISSASALSSAQLRSYFSATQLNRAAGASAGEKAQQPPNGEEKKPEQEEENKENDEKTKAGGEKSEEESNANGGKKGKKGKGKATPKKKSFMDHVRGLREDYAKFPDIYNPANMINFVVFTVFCLCSTGSNSEEAWWMAQWGLDNSFRPWTWLLHSFLTNNFLSMTYAMMLLHTMCHHVLPTLGSRGLMLYVGSTAVISGAIMWLGNYLYYGSAAAPEKQFGPWDVVGALFVMEYFYYGLTPFTIINSFSSWIKYAMWVGEVCILYFDWQPSLVGPLVGLALCMGSPRFKAMRPAAAAAGAK